MTKEQLKQYMDTTDAELEERREDSKYGLDYAYAYAYGYLHEAVKQFLDS